MLSFSMRAVRHLAFGIALLTGMAANSQGWLGTTTGKLPQLALSQGTDRLGNAKAGYIDSGLQVMVVDSAGPQYKLKLAAQRTAYLDKAFVQRPPAPRKGAPPANSPLPAPALMESWLATGSPTHDTVYITLNRPVPYTSWMETQPAAIMVELYNVQSNTNWINQLSSATGIAGLSWRQTESDVVQLRIQLHQQQHLGYQIGYQQGRLQIIIKRIPLKPRLKNMRIAIDAGHGGTNQGAQGVNTKVYEKDQTLLLAKALQTELEKHGVTTFMVRSADTTIDNKDRVLMLQQWQPDALISIHLNSSSRSTAKGVSTYYRHTAFRPLSQFILEEMLDIDGLTEFGNIGSFNFTPIQPTQYVSCLLEVAFLSNPQDEQLILQPDFATRLAMQVYQGLLLWARQLQ